MLRPGASLAPESFRSNIHGNVEFSPSIQGATRFVLMTPYVASDPLNIRVFQLIAARRDHKVDVRGAPVKMGSKIHNLIQSVEAVAPNRNANLIIWAEITRQGCPKVDDSEETCGFASVGTLIRQETRTNVVADYFVSDAAISPAGGAVAVFIGSITNYSDRSVFQFLPKTREGTSFTI